MYVCMYVCIATKIMLYKRQTWLILGPLVKREVAEPDKK